MAAARGCGAEAPAAEAPAGARAGREAARAPSRSALGPSACSGSSEGQGEALGLAAERPAGDDVAAEAAPKPLPQPQPPALSSSSPRASPQPTARLKRNTGHVGDLAPWQQDALEQLRSRLTEDDIKVCGVRNTDTPALLRYLRARQFQVDSAYDLVEKNRRWRADPVVQRLLVEKPPKYDLLTQLLPSAVHGVDRDGRPVVYEKCGKCELSALLALASPEEFLAYHVYKQERLVDHCEELSARSGRNVESFTMVLDMEGVDVEHRRGQELMDLCSRVDQEYFPERLGRLIIINPPYFFPVLYRLVAPLISPQTKKKIVVAYADYQTVLRKFIAPDQTPFEYGGTCKCPRVAGQLEHVWGCVPEFDLSELAASVSGQPQASGRLVDGPGVGSAAASAAASSENALASLAAAADQTLAERVAETTANEALDSFKARSRGGVGGGQSEPRPGSPESEEKRPSKLYGPLMRVVVPAGKKCVLELTILSRTGGSVAWSWRAAEHDLFFLVSIHREAALALAQRATSAEVPSEAPRILPPNSRPPRDVKRVQEIVRCSQHQGSFSSESALPTTVRLEWDNVGSLQDKTLYYRTTKLEMDEQPPL